jgi:hypothetical protein
VLESVVAKQDMKAERDALNVSAAQVNPVDVHVVLEVGIEAPEVGEPTRGHLTDEGAAPAPEITNLICRLDP